MLGRQLYPFHTMSSIGTDFGARFSGGRHVRECLWAPPESVTSEPGAAILLYARPGIIVTVDHLVVVGPPLPRGAS